MKYSIIIPVLNQIEYTVQCLNSIFRTTKGYPFEIIIIDNGSTDGTRSYINELVNTKGCDGCGIHIYSNKENVGFPAAVNQGLNLAQGEYLVILNNDTIVTQGWLARMTVGLNNAGDKLKLKKVGLIGPVTNFAGGRQQVEMQYNLSTLEDHAEKIYHANMHNWIPTGFLSGFCLMMKREVYDEVGNLDERFTPGGFEDNDYLLRAAQKGWKAIIAADTFVHHWGSKTLSQKEFENMKGGLANREKFYDKYRELKKKKQKLIGVIRAKNAERTIKLTIMNALKFCDELIILDDGSTDETKKIIENFGHYDLIHYYYQDTEFNERRDRNFIIQKAKEYSTDWIISIDADEIFENKFDRVYAEKLMNNPDPQVKCYGFYWYTFWRGQTHYRVDLHWGSMKGWRMFRVEENQEIISGNDIGFHCGNIPLFPPENCRFTSIRIKHYGYDDYDECKRKYDFYETLDHDRRVELIGGKNYNHIIDESTLAVKPWQEDNGVSAVFLCKDEAENLWSYLDSLYPWADEIICVMDSRTKDISREICQRYGVKIIEYEWKDNFSDARNTGLREAKQKWIFHLEPDEKFNVGNVPMLRGMMEETIQAYYFPVQSYHVTGQVSQTRSIRMFRNQKDIRYSRKVHETLEDSLKQIEGLKVMNSPVEIFNFGYRKGIDFISDKLDYYAGLCENEIKAGTKDARPYYHYGKHLYNLGKFTEAVQMYEKSLKCDATLFLPAHELALHHMRLAGKWFAYVIERLHENDPIRQEILKHLDYITKHAQELFVPCRENLQLFEGDK